MGCSSCASGVPKGCKSNGSCGVNGCEKLHVFDWLSGIPLAAGQKPFDVVEVRFKNTRKQFFRNIKDISLQVGDVVVVDGSPGKDLGIVSTYGELARIQVRKKNIRIDNYDMKNIVRKADQKDIDTWQKARMQENDTMMGAREIANTLKLSMKISDVEYQGDGSKAIFYYTAEDRVDFRELIKKLAEKFKVRVEMRQIGKRQEAARLGGIGSCGRELCCSTWLTDFRTVNTSAARYQQLSINPQKLAGQCGKLKCCLNYELDMYLEAIKDFPDTQIKIETVKGKAFHFKTDIFKKIIWYLYEGEGNGAPIPIPIKRVKEIIAMNKQGKKPSDLKDFQVVMATPANNEIEFKNAVGEDSLSRFDSPKKRKGKSKRKGGNKSKRPQNSQGGKNRNQRK